MAHFYLDLHECDHGAIVDEEGSDFGNIDAACAHAVLIAREVMAAEVKEGRLCLGCAIIIRDASGAAVASVPFVEALTVTMAGSC